jgi:hypothetical protein
MTEDQQGDSPAYATEPIAAEPGLLWLHVWSRNPDLASLFEPIPQMGIDGEIREVRVTMTDRDGSYRVQVGFIPQGQGIAGCRLHGDEYLPHR